MYICSVEANFLTQLNSLTRYGHEESFQDEKEICENIVERLTLKTIKELEENTPAPEDGGDWWSKSEELKALLDANPGLGERMGRKRGGYQT